MLALLRDLHTVMAGIFRLPAGLARAVLHRIWGNKISRPTTTTTQIGKLRLQYATPVDRHGKPFDWDDLELWEKAFANRGHLWEPWDSTRTAPADIDFNLGVGNTNRGGRIRRYEGFYRSQFHNKKLFFGHLAPFKLDCVPPTLLSAEEAEAAMKGSLEARPPLWFFKKATDSRGNGVFPCYTVSQVPAEHLRTDGVFQREVSNIKLWSTGAKFDLRVMVCADPGKRVFMYKTVFARVAAVKFEANNLKRVVQCTNLSQGGSVHVFNDDLHADGQVLDRVSIAVKQTMKAMSSYLQEGRFQYFGFDFLLDDRNKPWLLEVNSTPHLYRCNFRGDIVNMMEDLLENIIEPQLAGDEPSYSGLSKWKHLGW